ncbi:hypothetical protein ACKUVQ_24135 [Mycobacterium seoulense]|uniref:hypothetical protein n=1 Tax=Mycobacterium seoulense TaxID=386911 RepID=UPI003CF82745
MTKPTSTTSSNVGQNARSAGYVFAACALGFASATMAMPAAHADPLDNIRGAVNGARAQSTCQPLTYSSQLEADAQNFVRFNEFEENPSGYGGHATGFRVKDDPTAKATSEAVGQASPTIHDCTFKDFGVGMLRLDAVDLSEVAIVLGRPSAPAQQPPQAPAPNAHIHCTEAGGGYDLPVGSDCSKTPNPHPPAAPVTNAIQLKFGTPKFGSITATISNSSDLTAKCTYDSTPFNTHRDFTVNPHGSTDLTFGGINTNTNYHVVVSCHDASGKQTQEIGHQETNVAF